MLNLASKADEESDIDVVRYRRTEMRVAPQYVRKNLTTITWLLVQLATGSAWCQDVPGYTNLEIEIPHELQPELKHFDFPLKLQMKSGDKRSGELIVKCSPGLACQPLRQEVNFSQPNISPLSVDLVDKLNSGQIDFYLTLGDGSTLLTVTRALNFGLWDKVTAVGSDFPRELKGGTPEEGHLWLEDSDSKPVAPTSPIQLEVSAKDECAQVRTVQMYHHASLPNSAKTATITIEPWKKETTDVISVTPNVWEHSACTLEVVAKSGAELMTQAPLTLPIEPNFSAALVCCLLGAFLQYIVAATVQMVLATRSNNSVSFQDLFVGPNGVQIIEAALKGAIAFVVSFFLNATEIVQFKSTNTNPLLGFAVFGFLIGFWQLKPLWEAIKSFSDPPSPPATPPSRDAVPDSSGK